MEKFVRLVTRESFDVDEFWSAGYEFIGIAFPEMNRIEEYDETGFLRAHTYENCEKIPEFNELNEAEFVEALNTL